MAISQELAILDGCGTLWYQMDVISEYNLTAFSYFGVLGPDAFQERFPLRETTLISSLRFFNARKKTDPPPFRSIQLECSDRVNDAGRHLLRSPARSPEPQGEDQTLDIGTKQGRESTQRDLAANGSQNSLPEERSKCTRGSSGLHSERRYM